jgi:hypothetical protein
VAAAGEDTMTDQQGSDEDAAADMALIEALAYGLQAPALAR